ncbi:MAG: YcxB family protein [Tissierellia bacterium]|nr:YcxB family protein [Tissierellia bacterium]
MKYIVKYKPEAIDLWKLSMYGIYGSMVGVVNIIFTLAMLGLIVRFWGSVNAFLKILLLFGLSLFILIQPITIYFKSKKQIETVPQEMELVFDNKGMQINTLSQNTTIRWKKIRRIVEKSDMIIIMLDSNQGFIITNRMIETDMEKFYNYLVSKANK